MEAIKRQIAGLVNKGQNVLIAAPENINGDALGGALALTSALGKIGKSTQLVIPKELPKKFEFLPKTNSLSYDRFREREFVLSIQNPEDHINNLYYEKKDGLLHIYLKAKKKIEEKDFRVNHSHPFDLIFTINSQDFENLGKAFEYNPELFFETPVINIDNQVANENFGEINLIDITSSSVSEIVMGLIDFLGRNLLDKDIATWILTGLIDATDNFQSPKTTPRTFNNAALLINRGGDQQKVIRYFYKTKSLDFLRLWGRILHQLSWDQEKKLVWGKIREKDFRKTNTTSECLPQIFEEIKTAFPEMKTTFLVCSSSEEIKGTVCSSNSELLKSLTSKLSGVLKNGNLFFGVKNLSLEETEKQLLDLIDKEI
jgi:nanoRNase/pAp phosphatase (c-di-AMP/oligoRNAs hydrolase)